MPAYRGLAVRRGWPMGAWQADWPAMPMALGLMCVLMALLFSLARGYGGYVVSAWAIPIFGVAWAVFWIGFLRVGAQSALLFGPPAALLLMVSWLG